MPSNSQLSKLFRAIAVSDQGTAASIANAICESEERRGHNRAAKLLRSALTNFDSGVRDRRTPSISTTSSDVLSPALTRLRPKLELNQISLSKSVRSEIDDVIAEWRSAPKLRAAGIDPRSKLLFHGPPGCGKSATALALAEQLRLPVYMVRFDAVIGAFLGQTAIHLRQLFHFAETTPCVLLLDELDALGKTRGSPLDVGELDRIVISLMQELEHSRPLGVIIATTNLANLLDLALWRRFDLDLHFKQPNRAELRAFMAKLAKQRGLKINVGKLLTGKRITSYADAESAILSAHRKVILKGAEE